MKRNRMVIWFVLAMLLLAPLSAVRAEAVPSPTGHTEAVSGIARSSKSAPKAISTAETSGYGVMGIVLVLVSLLASRRSARDD